MDATIYFFLKKVAQKFAGKKNCVYLCTRKREITAP